MLTKFKPFLLITAYRDGQRYGATYYLEAQRIVEQGNIFIPMETKPLTKECLTGIANSVVSSSITSFRCRNLIPQNLVYYSYETYSPHFIWYVKAHSEYLYFHERLKIKNGLTHVPNLLFNLNKHYLRVFAVKSTKITHKTKLYIAPFHNVSTDGRVCLGNAISSIQEFKSDYIDDLMNFYETLFWKTKFSENHNSPYNLEKLWNAKLEEFPKEILKPSRIRMHDLINE